MVQERDVLAVDSRVESSLPELDQSAIEHQYARLRIMGSASAACGVIGLLLSVLALIGRVTGLFVLSSMVPGAKCMVPAAAFSFAVLSLAMLALSLPHPPPYRFVRACGLLVVLLGIARVMESALGADWDVTNLFLTHVLPPGPSDTQYAAVGAATISIIGLGTMFFTWRATRQVANGLGLSGTVVGILFCLAYLLGGPMIRETPLVSVALSSAFGLIVVGTGLSTSVSRWQRAVKAVTDARVAENQIELARLSDEAQRYAHELQTIMDYAPAGIIFYDPVGNIRRVNAAARAALGMTEEMVGKSATERFEAYDIVDEFGTQIMPDRGIVAAVLSGQTARNVLADFRKTPRGSVWVSMSGAPVPRGDGTIDGVVAVFADVTRLHDTQEQAKQLATELEAILHSIADGVAVDDVQGRALRTNPAADRILQYTDEIRAMTWQERVRVVVPIGEDGTPLDLDDFPLKRALEGERVVGFTMRYELLFKQPGELTPWLSVSAAPIHHGDEIAGAVLVLSDIAALRQTEQELRSYRDHLEGLVAERTASLEANQQRLRALAAELQSTEQRERQRLASLLHDEVAQTLGATKIHLGAFAATLTAPAAADQIATIMGMVDEAIRQSRAILMDLSPPVLQQQGLIPALLWWGQQIKEKHGLEVRVEVGDNVKRLAPEVEGTLFQIAKELLLNTTKYAQATQASITVTSDGARLKIEIADDGKGFDPSALEVTEKSGFGLFSVRERMAYLGGEFQLDSAPGRGTRATLTLPLEDNQPPAQ